MHTVRSWAMGMGLPAWLAAGVGAAQTPPMQPDIPATFTAPTGDWSGAPAVLVPMAVFPATVRCLLGAPGAISLAL